MLLLNIISAGLLTGAVYALMALGLSVIFGVIRIVNFAHGEMMVLGMFAAYALNRHLGLDPIAAMPLVAAAMFLAGYALQRGLINRFVTRPEHMQFLLMLAIAIMLVSLMLMGFGPDARNVTLDYAFDSYDIGGLLGGLLVGVSEALSGFFVDPSMKSMFSYGLLILVLLLRPQGLLGKRPG